MIPAVRAPGQPVPEDRGPAHLAGPIERSTGEGGDARALLLVLDAAGYGDGRGGLHVDHAAPPRLQRAREARVNVARTAWYTDRLPASASPSSTRPRRAPTSSTRSPSSGKYSLR